MEQANPGYSPIKGVVEKPSYENAPSNFGVAGRYILTPAIFDFLCDLQKGTGGEFQLTDAISLLLSKEKVHAVEFNGKRYDCGSKLGYLKATVNTALKHPELKNSFEEFLQELLLEKESECEEVV